MLPKFHIEDYKISEGRPRALCAADLNQDKKSDLAVTLWEKNAVSFFLAK